MVVWMYGPEEGKKEETLAIYEQLQKKINKYRAVSYTHLDVYKRQVFNCNV